MPSATRTARRSVIVAQALGLRRAQAAQLVMAVALAAENYLGTQGISDRTWVEQVRQAATDIWVQSGGGSVALSVEQNSPDAEPLFPMPEPPPFPHASDFPELFGERRGTNRATRAPRMARLHRHLPDHPETCTAQCTPPPDQTGDFIS